MMNFSLPNLRLLIANPNADDGLVPEITDEFRHRYQAWYDKVTIHTKKYAFPSTSSLSETNDTANPSQTEIDNKPQNSTGLKRKSDSEAGKDN